MREVRGSPRPTDTTSSDAWDGKCCRQERFAEEPYASLS
jgi:hypothetical protein